MPDSKTPLYSAIEFSNYLPLEGSGGQVEIYRIPVKRSHLEAKVASQGEKD